MFCGSTLSEQVAFQKLGIPLSPFIGEIELNARTGTSVPEGLWEDAPTLPPDRVLGDELPGTQSGVISVEIKRIFTTDTSHLEEMAVRAQRSCSTSVMKMFDVSHHVVAFMVHPHLFDSSFKHIRRELIRGLRSVHGETGIPTSVYVLRGTYPMYVDTDD